MGSTEKTAKVLLLGTGESGKSTIMKQMKILYHGGFTEQEHVGYKAVINRNILQSALAIVAGMDKMEIKFNSPAATEARRRLQELGSCLEEVNMSAELLYVLKELWKDCGFQAAIERSAEYQLNDSALYYLSDLDRVCGTDYIPSDLDILHACIRTTEIEEEQFIFKELNFRMFDAGGQRPERKKWISCFEDVTCIIFCTALTAYDLALVEDEEVNRMHESLHLFNSLCNHKFFTDTSIVLFLNKKDLFQDKISKVPLKVCFPNYNGSNTYEEAGNYIRQQFEDLNTNKGAKPIYTHLTCAVDTQDIESKMSAVIDIIMKNLKECGLL